MVLKFIHQLYENKHERFKGSALDSSFAVVFSNAEGNLIGELSPHITLTESKHHRCVAELICVESTHHQPIWVDGESQAINLRCQGRNLSICKSRGLHSGQATQR